MNSMLCTRCHKRPAVLFISRFENGRNVNEGLCLTCARELGIPQVQEILDKMGVSEEELDAMNEQLMENLENLEDGEPGEETDFEAGGAQPLPSLRNMFSGLIGSAAPSQGEKKAPEQGRGSEKEAKEKKAKELKFLPTYCENLTEKARKHQMDRIVGRDKEILRVMQILNRRTKNNPCLIGEPGVGKTAIAEGIAQRIASGNVPMSLQGKELYLLDLTSLVAGTQFRGQFESRVKGLVAEIKKEGNIILFIDEVHNLVGAGDAEGSMSAANIFKPALSRGEMQVIGATTFNEYRKHIEKDAALERRFQPVTVNEPSIADTIEVLRGIKGYYEEFHHVILPDDVLVRAANMAERYITDRYLPDKAIDLIDEACSCNNLDNKELEELGRRQKALARLSTQEEEIQQRPEVDYEELAKIRAERIRQEGSMKELKETAVGRMVTVDDLAKVIELWTGIPASKIRESEMERVAHLEEALKKKIIGQDEAVQAVAAAVRRSRVQISARRRPASFIFVGPTGVGKTELVKVLSQELFDTVDPLIRLDMSEFMEKHSVSRIVGSPPGYVGYDEAGQLTEKIRRRPYSVVLFDEIEKAHPDVMNILLQILDEGKITDAHGRVVSFENTVIVMTSNAGSNLSVGALGFTKERDEKAKEQAKKALSEFLRPEFLGRVDEIIAFRALDEDDFEKIAALRLEEMKEILRDKGIAFTYEESAVKAIASAAAGQKSGAREIQKEIRRQIEDPLSMLLVEHPQGSVTMVAATAEGNEIRLVHDAIGLLGNAETVRVQKEE